MGFFRSSESKSKSSKSKSRFSFRRQSEEGADVTPPTKASAPLSPPAPTRKRTASPRSPPPAPSSSALRGTIVSSASTSSASSSISSPTALQRAANDSDLETPKPSATTSSSVASAKRTSDSQASTDTEDAADFMRTPSESSILATPRESFDTHENAGPMSMEPSRTANASRKDSSDYTSARASTMVASRHSLVGYKKLQCSMSYKNRMAQGAGGDDPLLSATSAGSISLRASFNTGGRRSESSRSSSSRVSRGSGSYFSNSRENSGLSHIDEHSAAAPPPSSPSSHSRSSVEEPPSSEPADEADNESAAASSSMLLNRRMSELRLNEASVTALQTRRAFQQMVLAMEDEDGSSDDDSDDDDTSFQRPSSSLGRVVSLGVDDYRKFQFRLRQLEELTAEQARKQANIEQTIEQEVTQRTSKVVEAMEKKIAMYKQAKDLEVEREIQRRLSIEGGRMTTAGGGSARESSFYGGQMSMLGTPPPLAPVGDLKGKPLEKLFHPRRTRRRMELLREREEQQKKEMEQFREFIRVTEMRATNSDFSMTPMASARQNSEVVVAETARASIKALRDPHITEDLLTATPNELIEMICVLRKHVSVQETQLDQAKRLISAAIEAREEAEETAREAVELTMELDTRLERASQEIVVIKDELRRSSDFSMRSSYLFKSLDSNSQVSVSAPLTATETNGILPRTASFPNL